MFKNVWLAIVPLIFAFHLNLCWANPLDVDVGFVEVSDIQTALNTNKINSQSALGETAVDLYRVGIVLAMVADLETRFDRSEESLPRPSLSKFQKPEVGWRN